MTTPRARPTAAIATAPGFARLGAIGHFGVALGYLLGVLVLLRGVDAVLPALVVYGASTLALGVGWLLARPAFGGFAIAVGVLLLLMPPLGTVVGLVVGGRSGAFAALAGAVLAAALVGALAVAAGLVAGVAFSRRLGRDGAAGRTAMVLHIAPAVLGLLALALSRAGADGFAMALAVAAVLNAAAGHVAGGIVFLRLRSSSL